jgi:hypothetical protein
MIFWKLLGARRRRLAVYSGSMRLLKDTRTRRVRREVVSWRRENSRKPGTVKGKEWESLEAD